MNPEIPDVMMPPVTTERSQVCTGCGHERPVSDFHKRRHYVRSGHRARCKDCTRDDAKAARERRPQREDPKKARVRAKTRAALRTGELEQRPCKDCGSDASEPHHPRYDGPNAHLDVEWLCRSCHAKEHGKRAWTKQMELFGLGTSSR